MSGFAFGLRNKATDPGNSLIVGGRDLHSVGIFQSISILIPGTITKATVSKLKIRDLVFTLYLAFT
jgi:hypothetical protein